MFRRFAIPFFVFASLCVMSFRSGKRVFAGYKPVGNGSYLKMIKSSGSGVNGSEEGGLIFVHLKLKDRNDFVFMDLNNNPQYPGVAFPLPIKKPRFKGDVMDIMMKFHAGDSGTFFISLDSLKKYYQDTVIDPQTGQREISNEFDFHNEAYDTMKYVGFNMRVDSIYDKTRFDKLKEDENRRIMIQQQVNDTLGPLQASAMKLEPFLRENNALLLRAYLAKNNIIVEPDKDGNYFIEQDPGSGIPLQPGTTVSVLYTGRYLDGTLFDSDQLVKGQELLTFRVGVDPMITGFTDCMLKMKKGGKATFIISPAGGYKDSLTRVFDVQIVNPLK